MEPVELQTLKSQPIMPKNLPDHWCGLYVSVKLALQKSNFTCTSVDNHIEVAATNYTQQTTPSTNCLAWLCFSLQMKRQRDVWPLKSRQIICGPLG
jgi:hypothetical protein